MNVTRLSSSFQNFVLFSPFARDEPMAGDPEGAVDPLRQRGEGDVHLLPEHRDLKTNLDFPLAPHLLWLLPPFIMAAPAAVLVKCKPRE